MNDTTDKLSFAGRNVDVPEDETTGRAGDKDSAES